MIGWAQDNGWVLDMWERDGKNYDQVTCEKNLTLATGKCQKVDFFFSPC